MPPSGPNPLNCCRIGPTSLMPAAKSSKGPSGSVCATSCCGKLSASTCRFLSTGVRSSPVLVGATVPDAGSFCISSGSLAIVSVSCAVCSSRSKIGTCGVSMFRRSLSITFSTCESSVSLAGI